MQSIQDFINNNSLLIWLLWALGVMVLYAALTTLALIIIMVKKKKKAERYNMWKQNITDTFNFVVFKRKFEPPNSDELLEEVWSENQRLEKQVADCNKTVKQLTSESSNWKLFSRFALAIGFLNGLYREKIKEITIKEMPNNAPDDKEAPKGKNKNITEG